VSNLFSEFLVLFSFTEITLLGHAYKYYVRLTHKPDKLHLGDSHYEVLQKIKAEYIFILTN